MAQEFAQLTIKVGLLIKQFIIMNSEKVNEVGTQGRASKSYDSYVEEEDKFIDRELVSF